ncbi:hypothetical protein LIER_04085 [Lithospermum erythrorhizon]|uniref:Uncharacterized protein n=1 Tax=Lithospermum erythrorhizon TaxID=34254 RepID=A0AAV3NZN9_LITER
MAIPQEVADNIARKLNDAPGEGSLPFTEVLSAQPLAVRNLETAQANPDSTPSSTPAAPPHTSRAGASQPGTSANNTNDVLDVAQRCVEPKDFPFSTMAGECRPLFRKSKVRKVSTSSSTPARNEPSPSTATAAATSTSTAAKRPEPEEGRPKAFAPRKKHAAQRPKRIEHVTISEDLSTTSPSPPVPTDSVNPPSLDSVQEMPHLPSGSLNEDGADSGPRVSLGYSANFLNLPYTLPGGLRVTVDTTLWKKQDAFQASRPLILERALNASHSLACRSDALVNARAEAREEGRALRLQVQELVQKTEDLKGENEKLKTSLATAQKEKKEAQEQCIQEAEKLELLHTRYTRVEAENVGLNNRLKNAKMMADLSKKRADEIAQKLKEVEEEMPGQVQEAISFPRISGGKLARTRITACAVSPVLIRM